MSNHSMLDPHADQPVRQYGAPLSTANGVVILLHGRGSTAENILGLAHEFNLSGITYLAPQAASGTWYPQSFLAPRKENEPWLSSALATVKRVVELAKNASVPEDRIAIAGFSQGACLTSEFVASNPARYAAMIAFTGGLVGPMGSDLHHPGDLQGTPALLLSGDPDPHVPWQRVTETATELQRMGANVQAHRFPGRPHTITAQELDLARNLLQQVFQASTTDSGK